jgi:hypothetical protein
MMMSKQRTISRTMEEPIPAETTQGKMIADKKTLTLMKKWSVEIPPTMVQEDAHAMALRKEVGGFGIYAGIVTCCLLIVVSSVLDAAVGPSRTKSKVKYRQWNN